jgi:hypothetical protein
LVSFCPEIKKSSAIDQIKKMLVPKVAMQKLEPKAKRTIEDKQKPISGQKTLWVLNGEIQIIIVIFKLKKNLDLCKCAGSLGD